MAACLGRLAGLMPQQRSRFAESIGRRWIQPAACSLATGEPACAGAATAHQGGAMTKAVTELLRQRILHNRLQPQRAVSVTDALSAA